MPDIKKLIDEAKAAYVGPRFLGFPDEWYEPHPVYWCKNGHRSVRYLKRDATGECQCLACYKPVMLGPKELPGVVPN